MATENLVHAAFNALRGEEHASLVAGGAALEVVTLSGKEGLSTLFEYEAVCAGAEGGPEPASLLGAPAEITLRDGYGAVRRLDGIVTEAAREVFDDGRAELVVTVRPAMFLLTLGRDSRVFQDMTVVDIAKKVLSRSKAPSRWEVTEKYRPHIYCAQYREDDWTFISRMLEEEGIYYWFDHEGEQTTLVLSDRSTSADDLSGGAFIPFNFETGMKTSEIVEELGQTSRAVSTHFTVSSFDPDRPMLAVTASDGDGGPLEVYDAPGGGPEAPEVCALRALVRREAAVAAGAGVKGLSTSVRLVPGRIVEIGGHARLDGRYLVTTSNVKVVQRRRGTGGQSEGHPFACTFEGVPASVRFRALEATPLAEQAGLQSAVVVGTPGEEIHPDERGCVRAQLHWDREGARDDKAGKWVRIAQRGTAQSMLLPRTGWNVMTFNQEGAVDAPTILSRVHDAEHPPSYSLPDAMTRVVFKTATTPGGGSFNEIRFEDKEGSQEMFLNASKDMNVLVKDMKSDVVSRNQSRKIGNNLTRDVKAHYTEAITNDQQVSVSGNEELSVSGDRKKAVDGNEKVSVGGNRKLKVGTKASGVVKKTRKLTVTGNLDEQTAGNMLLRGETTELTITGSMMKQSDGNIAEDISKTAQQTVTGPRIEIAKESKRVNVSETYDESVTGSMMLSTEGLFVDGANDKSDWTIGTALSGAAPHVYLDAKDKIEIRCGSSVITLTTERVEISAQNFELSNAPNIDAVTKIIKHN